MKPSEPNLTRHPIHDSPKPNDTYTPPPAAEIVCTSARTPASSQPFSHTSTGQTRKETFLVVYDFRCSMSVMSCGFRSQNSPKIISYQQLFASGPTSDGSRMGSSAKAILRICLHISGGRLWADMEHDRVGRLEPWMVARHAAAREVELSD